MSNVLIGFVGDVIVNRDRPAEAFREVRDVLKVPDVLLGNLACAYSDNPHRSPSAALVVGPPAHNLDVYAEVGFTAVSMANNHILDLGYEAMLETRARLRTQGVATCGAGESDVDARRPAVVGVKDVKIAFLSYASVFPIGYEARFNSPGLAPLRSHNIWRDRFPGYYLPGYAPVVTVAPEPDDLRLLERDISEAREQCDIVVTSFRWGDFTRPFHLTEHERTIAKHCIDQGADMVVGHLHHSLRGMEWYKNKPIMYGLGHFIIDSRLEFSADTTRRFSEPGYEDTSYEVGPRKGWPLHPFHKDCRMTMVAWANASANDGISDIGFLPCRLAPDGSVHPLELQSKEGDEVIAYLEQCNRTQGIQSVISATEAVSFAGFKSVRVTPG